MPDTRSRRQKLEAMARQTVSPNEADIARAKLRELPPEPRRHPVITDDMWQRAARPTPADQWAYSAGGAFTAEDITRIFNSLYNRPPWRSRTDRTRASRQPHEFKAGPTIRERGANGEPIDAALRGTPTHGA